MLVANTKTEFLERGRDITPRDFVLCHDEMSSMAASVEAMWRSRGELAYLPAFVSFLHLPATVSEWVAEEMIKPDYPKSVKDRMAGGLSATYTMWLSTMFLSTYTGCETYGHCPSMVSWIVLVTVVEPLIFSVYAYSSHSTPSTMCSFINLRRSILFYLPPFVH